MTLCNAMRQSAHIYTMMSAQCKIVAYVWCTYVRHVHHVTCVYGTVQHACNTNHMYIDDDIVSHVAGLLFATTAIMYMCGLLCYCQALTLCAQRDGRSISIVCVCRGMA